MAIATNPSSESRSNHINERSHFIQNIFRASEIRFLHVATEGQCITILTKALCYKRFTMKRAELMSLA